MLLNDSITVGVHCAVHGALPLGQSVTVNPSGLSDRSTAAAALIDLPAYS